MAPSAPISPCHHRSKHCGRRTTPWLYHLPRTPPTAPEDSIPIIGGPRLSTTGRIGNAPAPKVLCLRSRTSLRRRTADTALICSRRESPGANGGTPPLIRRGCSADASAFIVPYQVRSPRRGLPVSLLTCLAVKLLPSGLAAPSGTRYTGFPAPAHRPWGSGGPSISLWTATWAASRSSVRAAPALASGAKQSVSPVSKSSLQAVAV